MGVKVEGVEALMWALKQGGERAVRGAAAQMKIESESIADLARKMAPLDEGNLEDAIRVQEDGGGRDSATGRFVKKEYTIYIDGNMPAGVNKEGAQTVVGDYAYIMHEHLTPFGPLNLGPESRRKQSGSSIMVGGKFLERAVAEQSKGLVGRVIERVKSEL